MSLGCDLHLGLSALVQWTTRVDFYLEYNLVEDGITLLPPKFWLVYLHSPLWISTSDEVRLDM